MSRMKDQRRALKQAQKDKRRSVKGAAQTLEIDEQDIIDEVEDLDRRMLELES